MITLLIKTDDVSLLKSIIDHVEIYTQQSLKELEASIEWDATRDDKQVAHQRIEFKKGKTTTDGIRACNDRRSRILNYLQQGRASLSQLKIDCGVDGKSLRPLFTEGIIRRGPNETVELV